MREANIVADYLDWLCYNKDFHMADFHMFTTNNLRKDDPIEKLFIAKLLMKTDLVKAIDLEVNIILFQKAFL